MSGLLKFFNEVIQPEVDHLDRLLKMTDQEYIKLKKAGKI